MNKKYRKLFKNGKIVRVILSIILISIGLMMVHNTLQDKQKKVSAHPTDIIKLDEGQATEFELPIDATKLEENRLINDNIFDGYVQNDNFVLSPTKVSVKGFSTVQPSQYFLMSERTNTGNVLVLGRVGTWGTGVSYPFSTTFLFLMDEDNTVIDSIQMEGTSINETAALGYGTEGTSLKKNSDGTFSMLSALGVTTIVLNNAETSIETITRNEFSFSGDQRPQDMNYGSIDFGLDNKIYYSGNWSQISDDDPKNNYLDEGRNIAILNNGGVEENRLKLKYRPCADVLTNPLYMAIHALSNISKTSADEEISGIIKYVGTDGNSYDMLATWDVNGNLISEYSPAGQTNTIKALNQISSTSERFFFVKSDLKSELIKFETSTGQFSKVGEFPVATDLELIRLQDNSYNAIGYLSETTGVFAPFANALTDRSTFSANFSSDFKLKSIVSIESGLERDLAITTATFIGDSRYFFSANFNESSVNTIPNTSFVDEVESQLGSNSYWTEKSPGANTHQQSIFGVLELIEDYTPAIISPDNITYDIDDVDLDNNSTVNSTYGWSVRDNWLITGTKTGLLTDSESIKVFDVYDTELSLSPQPTSWHYARLNRNPLDVNQDINWKELGLDENEPGPQIITYFVTDSQQQASVKSRWVNKVTDQTNTDEDDQYALDAQNFHIPLTGIDKAISDANKFKELAKTMAWSLTKHGSADGDQGNGLDEDGTDSHKRSPKVTVNVDQLNALKAATVAKPYPVDVTYEPENGIEIRNRVWVFVTTKNTVPNSKTNPEITPADTNGVVYYADDYSLPFRLRSGHAAADVLDRGNVRVYDYFDSTHETDNELTALADKDTNSNDLQILQLGQIHAAGQPGTIDFSPPDGPPMIRYEWQGPSDGNHQTGAVTLGGLDVTLAGDVLLHVRQVILDDSDELVVPKEGYLRLKTNEYDSGTGTANENSDYLRQVKIPSGTNTDNPDFETFAVSTDHMNDEQDELELELVLPEYYEQLGNYLTLARNDPNGAEHQDKTESDMSTNDLIFHRVVLNDDGEYFITIYLKPRLNQEGPQPYSWDYKKNDLGKIKTQ